MLEVGLANRYGAPSLVDLARFICVLMLFVMSDCFATHRGEFASENDALANIILTQEDQDKSITVKVNDAIAIQLRENPSTGYRWALENETDEVLEPISSDYVAASEPAVGGGGLRIWKFKAIRQGSVRLKFKLRRPWEGETPIVSRFDVTITVL